RASRLPGRRRANPPCSRASCAGCASPTRSSPKKAIRISSAAAPWRKNPILPSRPCATCSVCWRTPTRKSPPSNSKSLSIEASSGASTRAVLSIGCTASIRRDDLLRAPDACSKLVREITLPFDSASQRRAPMRIARILGAAIAAWLCAAPLYAAEVKDRAEAEGKLIFYTTSNAADAKAVTDGFKRIYPRIDVQFERSTDSQMMEKILSQARAGKPLWDVVSTTGYYGYLLKKRGLLPAYDSPERKYFRDGFKDPQGFWTSTYTTYAVFGYNTRLVSRANVPRSHEDLLKPFWKGQVGMEGRGYEWFTATISGMGREKGLSFMRALAANNPALRVGRTLLAQLVAAGEFNG